MKTLYICYWTKKWEINLIYDHKHTKRDQGFQKVRVICIAFWPIKLQIIVWPLMCFLKMTFRSPWVSVVMGWTRNADNPELLKSPVSFCLFIIAYLIYFSFGMKNVGFFKSILNFDEVYQIYSSQDHKFWISGILIKNWAL